MIQISETKVLGNIYSKKLIPNKHHKHSRIDVKISLEKP